MSTLTNPERQFLGCLMRLPADKARHLLAGMRADDLADPVAAFVLQLAIELVALDQPPAPVAVFVRAVNTGRAVGEHRQTWLGGWIGETYSDTTTPALAPWLKTAVLEAAWRRALATHAHRVAQAADGSPAEVLRDVADDMATVDDLWARYQSALEQPARLESLPDLDTEAADEPSLTARHYRPRRGRKNHVAQPLRAGRRRRGVARRHPRRVVAVRLLRRPDGQRRRR